MNWLYQEISNTISGFFYTWFYTFVGLGVVGLILGIILVVALGRRKMFARPNSLWAFVAKLNYVYTPVCFAALFGLFGAIYGIQIQTDNWIDYSAEPIKAFGKEILPAIDVMAPRLNASADLDDAIYGLMENGYEGSYYEKKILAFVLSHYTQMVVHEFGYPSTVNGLNQMMSEYNFAESDERLLQRLPNAAKSYYGIFFWGLYKKATQDILPYVLIPVVEFLIFFLLVKAGLRSSPTFHHRVVEESEYV